MPPSLMVTDRRSYFRAYQQRHRELRRELGLARDMRTCAATDCDAALTGKRQGTRFCSNPCWQRERYRRKRLRSNL